MPQKTDISVHYQNTIGILFDDYVISFNPQFLKYFTPSFIYLDSIMIFVEKRFSEYLRQLNLPLHIDSFPNV